MRDLRASHRPPVSERLVTEHVKCAELAQELIPRRVVSEHHVVAVVGDVFAADDIVWSVCVLGVEGCEERPRGRGG